MGDPITLEPVFIFGVLNLVGSVSFLLWILTKLYSIKSEVDKVHRVLLQTMGTSDQKIKTELNKRLNEHEKRLDRHDRFFEDVMEQPSS